MEWISKYINWFLWDVATFYGLTSTVVQLNCRTCWGVITSQCCQVGAKKITEDLKTKHEFVMKIFMLFRVRKFRERDDVIKWKHFPRYWPFVRGIHRLSVNSHRKGQWHGALMFSLICAWINGWVNNSEAGDLRRHCAHYDGIVMDLTGMPTMFHVITCTCHGASAGLTDICY